MKAEPKVWRGSCAARCAHTGKRCALPDDGHKVHSAGRTKFEAVAAAGQEYFAGADALAAAATASPEPVIEQTDTPWASRRASHRRSRERATAAVGGAHR